MSPLQLLEDADARQCVVVGLQAVIGEGSIEPSLGEVRRPGALHFVTIACNPDNHMGRAYRRLLCGMTCTV